VAVADKMKRVQQLGQYGASAEGSLLMNVLMKEFAGEQEWRKKGVDRMSRDLRIAHSGEDNFEER